MNEAVSKASAALTEMLGQSVSVDGLLVDEATGEIQDWPEGITGDRFEWLTLQALRAERNVKGWEATLALYKLALGRMLTDAGQRAIATRYGKPRWASRVDRVANPERVPLVVQQLELGREIELLIWMTAKALDPKKITELESNGILPEGTAKALIEDKPRGPWLQIDAPREQPPEIER